MTTIDRNETCSGYYGNHITLINTRVFILNTVYFLKKILSFLIAEYTCGAVAIASLARTTDFAANLRPVDWLITNPSEVKFTTDTMTVKVVLKSNCARRIAPLLGI